MKGKSIYIPIIGAFLNIVSICLFSHGQTPRPVPASYSSTINKSYIRTISATSPEMVSTVFITKPLRDVKQSTRYFDGLGRPLQTVVKQGSLTTGGTAVDLISMIEYDAFAREKFDYLPTPSTATDATKSDGKFKLNPFAQQASFYNSTDPAKNPIANQGETFFYGQKTFEASPLNRVMETFAAGDSWVKTSLQQSEANRRSVKSKYFVNTTSDEVRIWNVINSSTAGSFGTYATPAGTAGIYPAGALYKNVTADEKNKQVIEFKDKNERVILKKVQLTAPNDTGEGSAHPGWLCTYYLYDDLSNLRCVIQPQGVEILVMSNWSSSAMLSILQEQCFRYEYDQRNRMIMKKTPGVGEVNMVYDKRDRLVMEQDANNKIAPARWIVTKYDDLNRVIETGIWTNASVAVTHRTNALNTFPYPATLSGYELLTLIHFDDYNSIPGASGLDNLVDASFTGFVHSNLNTSPDYAQPVPTVSSTATKGKITWVQTKVLGTSGTYLFNVNIYDEKERLSQVKSRNHTAAVDITTTQYDWTGKALVIVQKHVKGGSNPQTHLLISKMSYDELGRLLTIRKNVNSTINSVAINKPEQVIVQNEYDALGQLRKKRLAPAFNANAGLQVQVYDYNIRGWLLGINRNHISANGTNPNFFGFELGYDKVANSSGRNFLVSQYDGNVAGMIWKSNGDGIRRKYDFAYDPIGRLMKGIFEQNDAGTTWGSTSMNYGIQVGSGVDPLTAYDANGNIKTMTQWGWRFGVPATTPLDNMRYTYVANSNRLKSVKDFNNDPLTRMGDFQTSAAHPQAATKNALLASSTQASFDAIVDYDYDLNGNLKLDHNKSISSIGYNHLNLPTVISVTGKGSVTYTYDAAGNKLTKVVTETGQPSKTTLYLGGAVYENDVLQFFIHEEGRIRFKPAIAPAAAKFEYDYMLKDHLGNVRMVLTEESQLDIYPVVTLEGPIPNATTTSTSLASIEKDFYTIDNNFIVANPAGINISPNAVYQNNNMGTNNNPNCTGSSCTTVLSANVYRLNASTNKTGLGITLKVMAGDKINISGKSYHKQPAGTTYTLPVSLLGLIDILNAFTGSAIISSKGITGAQLNSNNTNPPSAATFFVAQPAQSPSVPQAFINYILFDEQFKYAGSGFVQVGNSGVLTTHVLPNIPVTKNGYIFVYCSNESNYDVFFDNLHVTHNRGPVLEETHYYPFGLVMPFISPKSLSNTPENKYKFNDGSELSNKEFMDGTGLEIYETPFRRYHAQIGRFCQIDPLSSTIENWSPYAYVLNSPIIRCDPTGLKDSIVTLPNVTIYSPKAKQLVGGSFNGQSFNSIREYVNYGGGLRKEVLTNEKALENLLREVGSADQVDKLFDKVGSFGGAVTALKYVTMKDLAKGKFKATPLMIMATYIAYYGMKYGDYGEGLQKVVNDYVCLHKDAPENQNGLYSIERIDSYPSAMNNGLKSVITVSFYDISTKKFIGNAVIR